MFISCIVLTPWTTNANSRIDNKDNVIRFLSFRNPYLNVENCPVEIRVEYDFTLVYTNGEISSHCGMQETTLMPFSAASVDLRRGSPANDFEASFILNDAIIYVTNGGYVYQFYYNQTGQREYGGNCIGSGSNYFVQLDIESQSAESIAYSLWYDFYLKIR